MEITGHVAREKGRILYAGLQDELFGDIHDRARVRSGGFCRARRGEPADIYVVNSCSVTEHADKKCRNLVRRLIRENPRALVAVTGCYAQLRPRELASIEGVDLVVGNGDKGSLFERIASMRSKGGTVVHGCEADELTSFFAAFSTGDRTTRS